MVSMADARKDFHAPVPCSTIGTIPSVRMKASAGADPFTMRVSPLSFANVTKYTPVLSTSRICSAFMFAFPV